VLPGRRLELLRRVAQVANTLWSYATLGHDPGSQLLDAIAAHMCDRMHVFRPQAISNSLWVRRRCLKLVPAARATSVAIEKLLQSSKMTLCLPLLSFDYLSPCF
jgi:hypothetical protein